MSIDQMKKVFDDVELKGNEKLLMLALADNSNDTGVSFPSWTTLITKTSMSRGSIAKWLIELEDKGLLFRVGRTRLNGSKTSNKFLIYPHINKDILDEQDYLTFKDLYDQSSEVELGSKVQELNYPSSEVELGGGDQSSEVELLEPSLNILNHQEKECKGNFSEKKDITPFLKIENKINKNPISEIINFYKENISSKNEDIQETASFNQIALRNADMKKIMKGLINYERALKISGRKPIKLFFFIRDRIYEDYQEDQAIVLGKNQIVVPIDLVGKIFMIDGEEIEFENDGYNKVGKDWKVTNAKDVEEMVNLVRGVA